MNRILCGFSGYYGQALEQGMPLSKFYVCGNLSCRKTVATVATNGIVYKNKSKRLVSAKPYVLIKEKKL